MSEAVPRVCEGCGGRNQPAAETCDWCARPFSEHRRWIRIRWWQLAAALVLASVVAAVVGVAALSTGQLDLRLPWTAASGPTGAVAATPPAPTPATATAKPAGFAPTVTRPPAPTATAPAAAPPPPPTATPAPPRYVRVGNTNGLGVNLRKDPGPQGQPLIAVSDNTLLRLVGPEETVQARVWRLCEHQGRGVQGWAPADFLQQTDLVPTPGRT